MRIGLTIDKLSQEEIELVFADLVLNSYVEMIGPDWRFEGNTAGYMFEFSSHRNALDIIYRSAWINSNFSEKLTPVEFYKSGLKIKIVPYGPVCSLKVGLINDPNSNFEIENMPIASTMDFLQGLDISELEDLGPLSPYIEAANITDFDLKLYKFKEKGENT